MHSFYSKTGDWHTIGDALAAYTVAELTMLAQAAGTNVAPRKAEWISNLVAALTGPSLERLVGRMTTHQRAALAMAAHAHDGRLSWEGFRKRHGVDPDFGHQERFRSGIQQPSLLCLFLHGDRIPDDLRARVRAILSAPEAIAMPTIETPPMQMSATIPPFTATNRGSEAVTRRLDVFHADRSAAAEAELLDVLRLVESGALAVTPKTGDPTASATRNVTKILVGGGDFLDLVPRPEVATHAVRDIDVGPIRAFAWPRVVCWAGFAKERSGHLTLTDEGRAALAAPPSESLRTIWQAYIAADGFEEVQRLSAVLGASSAEARFTPRRARREAIAASLAEYPEGRWVTLDAFFDHLRMTGRDFEVARAPWALRIESSDYRKTELDRFGREACWNVLQARVIMCLLFEYAATLGLVDVAFTSPIQARGDIHDVTAREQISRYDGLACFRLTPMGSYCLGTRTVAPPSAVAAGAGLRVTSDLRLLGAGELTAADRLMLETCAVISADGAWQLDRSQILEAVTRGRSVARFREFLQRRAEGPLPDEAAVFLADCEQRAGALRLRGEARIYECPDEATADAIVADPRTAKHCVRSGDRLVAVFVEYEPAFKRALRNVGFGIRGSDAVDGDEILGKALGEFVRRA